jgi:hypothetical protein
MCTSRIFNRLRRSLPSLPSKSAIGLGVLQALKLGQSVASSLFSFESNYGYASGTEIQSSNTSIFENPYVLAAGTVVIVVAGYMCIRTSLSSMRQKYYAVETGRCSSCRSCKVSCVCVKDVRDCGASFVSTVSKKSSRISSGFVGLNTAFSFFKFLVFTQHLLRLTGGSGLIILFWCVDGSVVIANFYSYHSLNVPSADESTDRIVEAIRTGNWEFDRYAAMTTGVVLVFSFPTVTFAYFSTSKAVELMSGDSGFFNYCISLLSAIPAAITGVMQNLTAFHQWLKSWFVPNELPTRSSKTFMALNIADNLNNSFGAPAVATVVFLNKTLKADLYSPGTIGVAVFFALPVFILTITFKKQANEKRIIHNIMSSRELDDDDKIKLLGQLAILELRKLSEKEEKESLIHFRDFAKREFGIIVPDESKQNLNDSKQDPADEDFRRLAESFGAKLEMTSTIPYQPMKNDVTVPINTSERKDAPERNPFAKDKHSKSLNLFAENDQGITARLISIDTPAFTS